MDNTQTTTVIPIVALTVLSNSSTNEEIRKFFENFPQFKEGKAVIANIEEKDNVVRCMFVQNRVDLPITNTTNPLLAMAMQWENTAGRTVRAWQNFEPAIFAKLQEQGVTVGSTGEEVFAKLAELTSTTLNFNKVKISVVEDNVPEIWNNEHAEEVIQKPLSTRRGLSLTHKGLPIYQHTELCFDDTIVDVLITADRPVNLRQTT